MPADRRRASGEPAGAVVERPSYLAYRGALRLPVVLSCEHASDRLPEEFGDLGMAPEQRAACHGHDPGAEEIFDHLVRELDVHGVKARVSRLVIDLNRYLDQPDVVRERCAGRPIPANAGLSDEEFRRRVDRYYRPYHDQLRRLLVECEERHGAAFFFLIHTMAEELGGQVREQDFALVRNRGRDVSRPVRRSLQADGYSVTVNDPFGLDHDLVRCERGSPLERFNERAVLVEVNERHAGDRRVMTALSRALRAAVEEWDASAGDPGVPGNETGEER